MCRRDISLKADRVVYQKSAGGVKGSGGKWQWRVGSWQLQLAVGSIRLTRSRRRGEPKGFGRTSFYFNTSPRSEANRRWLKPAVRLAKNVRFGHLPQTLFGGGRSER